TPAVEGPLARLIAPFVLLHAAMFVYDMQYPERFFFADRAGDRIISLDRMLAALHAGDLGAMLPTRGVIGDWLPQGLLYLAGGMTLVVLVQVLLVLFSIACVRRIGLRLGLAEAGACTAAAIYGLLPHTLVYPHELASEGLFVPLVVIAFTFTSGLAMGAAILIRPVAALWPLFTGNKRYIALALLPLVAWMGFVKMQTGELSIGKTHADLGSNLYQRAVRMTGGKELNGSGRMSTV